MDPERRTRRELDIDPSSKEDMCFDTDPRNIDCFHIVKNEIARYVGVTLSYGDALSDAIKNMVITLFELPEYPEDEAGTVATAFFKDEMK
eukprot:9991783-Ditylum_brightwellii.AAC.1